MFTKLIESEKHFKGNCSQKTWLLIITRNYCLNRLSKRELQNYSYDQNVFNKTCNINLDEKLTLQNALQKLLPEENELIYLREYEGFSYKEIADLTNQSLENVKIKLYRIRKKLREILSES